jgi:hypothetical protein
MARQSAQIPDRDTCFFLVVNLQRSDTSSCSYSPVYIILTTFKVVFVLPVCTNRAFLSINVMVFELRDLVTDTMGRLVEGVPFVARTFSLVTVELSF